MGLPFTLIMIKHPLQLALAQIIVMMMVLTFIGVDGSNGNAVTFKVNNDGSATFAGGIDVTGSHIQVGGNPVLVVLLLVVMFPTTEHLLTREPVVRMSG